MPFYHHASEFGPGPRTPLDYPTRRLWQARLKLERKPGGLTIGAARVGETLLRLLGDDGRLDPSHDTLATLACVHVNTVRRALVQLRDAGFVRWTRRLIRGPDGARQTSSAYELTMPGSHSGIQVISKVYKKAAPFNAVREQRIADENAARQLAWLRTECGARPPGASRGARSLE